ncbi:unnamed protein product [Toxocara canis]|nr:unnamed protein product [Toxocara canis]
MNYSTTPSVVLLGNEQQQPADVKKRKQKTTLLHSTNEAFRFESIECKADAKKRRAYRSILRLIRQQLVSASLHQHSAASVAAGPQPTMRNVTNRAITSSAIELSTPCTAESNPSSMPGPNTASVQAAVEPQTTVTRGILEEGIERTKVDEEQPLVQQRAQASVNLSTETLAAALVELAPSVYEDPFCAVTADGTVHISEYYLMSDGQPSARLSNHDKGSSKSIPVCEIAIVFYANASQSADTNLCRTWGLTKNSVWWAADSARNGHTGATCSNVVLRCVDTHPLQHGFTVVSVSAFIGALKACRLPQSCRFVAHLPQTSNGDETLQ